ncbi:MAG: hypothetical protein J5I35_07640 [Methanothrix harundinacea]|nr:hypothetical protein [Methanothrix harundinacea]
MRKLESDVWEALGALDSSLDSTEQRRKLGALRRALGRYTASLEAELTRLEETLFNAGANRKEISRGKE